MTSTGSTLNDSGISDDRSFDLNNNPEHSIQRPIGFHNGNAIDTSSNDNEDWHFIDPDEHLEETHASQEHKRLNRPNVYVEVNPLEADQVKYSKSIIYLCTALYALIPIAALISLLTLICLLFTGYYYISIIYILYIMLDRHSCNIGGSRIDFVYRSKFWSYLASYFPIKIRFREDLKFNPNDNYLLIYHPHGISAFGSVTAFATNGLKFTELFPGMTCRFMVHQTSFKVPLMREIFSFRGDCSVNARSIDYILTRPQRGNILTLVSGGLAEADLSDMDVLKLVLKDRKGFVKKAIQHGAHLVPCIAFGENSVFTKINHKPGSVMDRLESRWYKIFKFKHPAYYGTSIFSRSQRGCMPYKRPITVVIGNPIMVPKIDKPTQADIDLIHRTYITSVCDMYHANKDLCVKFDKSLILV